MKSQLIVVLVALAAHSVVAEDYTPKCDPARESTYYVPHTYDCAQFFACSKGVPSPALTCPTDLLFHPIQEKCRPSSELPPDAECLNPPTSPTPSTLPPSSSPSTPPSGVCQGMPAGTYLPDPEDCSKYYICIGNDGAMESFCPNDLFFHPDLHRCVLPDQMPPTAPCLQKTCAGKPDGTYLPHPSDCKKYFICVASSPQEYSCPGTLFFHPETFQCVPADQLPPSSPCYPDTPWTPDCTGKPEGTYLENPFDCTSYYICLSGSPQEFTCPDPLFFNPTSFRCVPLADRPSDAACLQNPGTSTLPSSSSTERPPVGPEVCKGKPDGTLLPSPLTCQEYFSCTSGAEETIRCGDGFVFIPTAYRCGDHKELPADAECRKGPVEQCKVDSDYTYYRDPFSCHGYYQCLEHVASRHSCPDYLAFHLPTISCVWPSTLPVADPCYEEASRDSDDLELFDDFVILPGVLKAEVINFGDDSDWAESSGSDEVWDEYDNDLKKYE